MLSVIPGDLIGTTERLQATEVFANGFRLNDKFVKYSRAFRGTPHPTIQISVSQSTGQKFVRWEVMGISADAPDDGAIDEFWFIEQGAIADDPPGWWRPRSIAFELDEDGRRVIKYLIEVKTASALEIARECHTAPDRVVAILQELEQAKLAEHTSTGTIGPYSGLYSLTSSGYRMARDESIR